MIALFTDFGVTGPYVGQMQAVLLREAPDVPSVTLFSDAPTFDPRLSAYLLAAYVDEFPPGTVFLCVVDPGVGSERRPVVLEADGRFYVGPDNGLFELVARRATGSVLWWEITWRPETLSASFHGRDLFSPVAARIACGEALETGDWVRPVEGRTSRRPDWPDDLAQVVYVDAFGNAMTGVRADSLAPDAEVAVAGRRLERARTFSDVPEDTAFWYENANGLVEIAVNQGRADAILALRPGSSVTIANL